MLACIAVSPHHKGMPLDRSSLQALKNIIEQVDLLISTTVPLPENRTPRCRELLKTALALTDDVLRESKGTAARFSTNQE
jgi:hypothetical protein